MQARDFCSLAAFRSSIHWIQTAENIGCIKFSLSIAGLGDAQQGGRIHEGTLVLTGGERISVEDILEII